MYAKNFFPQKTPKLLKAILFTFIGAFLFSSYLFPFLPLYAPETLKFHFWQLFTYPFASLFPSGLISLAFNLYLLWAFGTPLMERLQSTKFSILFLGSTLLGAFFALGTMTLFSHHPPLFFGMTPIIYALLASWAQLNKETHLFLFFLLPIKASTLVLVLVGFSLASDLASGQLTSLFATLGALSFSYLFTLLACKTKSSISFLAPFEKGALRALERMTHWKTKPGTSRAKIYDIHSGKTILNDQEFMDAMLSKISLQGESALSLEEKKRMDEIAKKRSKKNRP